MNIYVAGKWEEKERVQEVQAQLIAVGHTISHDWTIEESTTNSEELTRHAVNDRYGVLNADAYVGVFEKDLRYSGALAEFGIAIARGIPCYILGTYCDRNVFINLPFVRKGLEELLAKGRAV